MNSALLIDQHFRGEDIMKPYCDVRKGVDSKYYGAQQNMV